MLSEKIPNFSKYLEEWQESAWMCVRVGGSDFGYNELRRFIIHFHSLKNKGTKRKKDMLFDYLEKVVIVFFLLNFGDIVKITPRRGKTYTIAILHPDFKYYVNGVIELMSGFDKEIRKISGVSHSTHIMLLFRKLYEKVLSSAYFEFYE